jgi:ATP-dependent exoDNAse (exonuclease V) alpha subunit
MLRRNDARLNVCNGQTGAVISVDRAAGSLIIAFDDGACRAVPHNYIAAGGVTHGYATTIHKAQGLTVDRCLVLADELIYRESAYVALSRGRARNQLYVVDEGNEVENATHGPTRQRDRLASLNAALASSRSQSLALDQLDRRRTGERDVDLSAEIEL